MAQGLPRTRTKRKHQHWRFWPVSFHEYLAIGRDGGAVAVSSSQHLDLDPRWKVDPLRPGLVSLGCPLLVKVHALVSCAYCPVSVGRPFLKRRVRGAGCWVHGQCTVLGICEAPNLESEVTSPGDSAERPLVIDSPRENRSPLAQEQRVHAATCHLQSWVARSQFCVFGNRVSTQACQTE